MFFVFACFRSANSASGTPRSGSPPARALQRALAENQITLEGLTVEDVATFAGIMQPATVRFNDLRWREFDVIWRLILPLNANSETFAHGEFYDRVQKHFPNS